MAFVIQRRALAFRQYRRQNKIIILRTVKRENIEGDHGFCAIGVNHFIYIGSE